MADGFLQFEPDEGKPASQQTEARVLYGTDALFVALRAFDTAPDSIAGQLTRRDQQSYSDQLSVVIDSYFDRRTAFQFMVNPVGVKTDAYLFDDVEDDSNWDAVWDVATAIDEKGWTAEFRIPYSQLRFSAGGEQTWGINFLRVIARHQEKSLWAPTRKSESAIVSKFGELRGLSELDPPRRLEVQPYTLGKVDRAPGEAANPFWSHNAFSSTVGADLKYGITSDLTLDVTINPDFGQVEADPSQVNLTAFETFLSEQRPFFVEGRNLFSFPLSFGDGDQSAEGLFYSRRLGRPPQGSVDAGDGWADDRTDQRTPGPPPGCHRPERDPDRRGVRLRHRGSRDQGERGIVPFRDRAVQRRAPRPQARSIEVGGPCAPRRPPLHRDGLGILGCEWGDRRA